MKPVALKYLVTKEAKSLVKNYKQKVAENSSGRDPSIDPQRQTPSLSLSFLTPWKREHGCPQRISRLSFRQIGLFPNIHILFTWPHENINIHSILKKCRALEKSAPLSSLARQEKSTLLSPPGQTAGARNGRYLFVPSRDGLLC